MIKTILKKVFEKESLLEEEAIQVFEAMLAGELTDAQVSCFLTSLSFKGESSTEIAAAAKILRKNSLKVNTNQTILVDTCGTGGDNSNSFNVSTGAAFIAAAAGVKIGKHGNRSASSNSGSADLLEEAGANINLTPENVAKCIEEVGIGFMFAPAHHKATKKVVAIRKELGIRTLFNLIGPLTNPSNITAQVIGIFDHNLIETYLEVLIRLKCEKALVVASADGLDEISVGSNTFIGELNGEEYKIFEKRPEDFGIELRENPEISVKNPMESLKMIESAFSGEDSAALDMLILNAGAVIYIGNKSESIRQGVDVARDVINQGKVLETFQKYIELTKDLT